jgi:hypothetical protein
MFVLDKTEIMSKKDIIYTMVNKETGVGYSCSTLMSLAKMFGYRSRTGEYWREKLKDSPFFETKGNIIFKTEMLKEKRGGKRSTSGLFGKPKNEDI